MSNLVDVSTLLNYTDKVYIYIEVKEVINIVEEYLLDEQLIISKIIVAATVGDVSTIKKYYNMDNIENYETKRQNDPANIQPVQDIMKSIDFLEGLLIIVSHQISQHYSTSDRLGCIEIVKWLRSNLYRLYKTKDHFLTPSFPMLQLSIDQYRIHYSGLSIQERKEIIMEIISTMNRGQFSHHNSDSFIREKNRIKDIDALITIYLAFEDEIKANKDLFDKVKDTICIEYSSERLYRYYTHLFDIIDKKRYISNRPLSLSWIDMFLTLYYGIEIKKCQKHNSYTLYFDTCYDCRCEDQYRKNQEEYLRNREKYNLV